MSYISHEDYKNLMSKFQVSTPKGMLKEGKQVHIPSKDSFKVEINGKTYTARYHNHEEGDSIDLVSDSGDTKKGVVKKVSQDGDLTIDLLEEGNAFTAALAKTKKGGEFKLGGKKIKDTSGYDNPSVKESNDAVDSKLDKIADLYKGKTIDFETIEKIVKGLETHGAEVNARYVQQYLGQKGVKLDEYSYTDNYPGSWGYREGLHMPPLQATGPTIDVTEREEKHSLLNAEFAGKKIAQEHGKELKALKAADGHAKYEKMAIELLNNKMKQAGVEGKTITHLFGYDEDWLPDYLSALGAELQGIEEGSTSKPNISLQEDVAPYGFEVLSPDEKKQLAEYIESVKTIKKEIARLAAKAGKKVKEEGGNRTGLVMTPTTVSETKMDSEKYERIEGLMNMKLHDTFGKVTEMIVKDLKEEGFDDSDIIQYLKHEVEKKAKKASVPQQDVAKDNK